MATLVYNPGTPGERVFPIRDGSATVGRAVDQAIWIPHESLSLRHASVERAGEQITVVDLGSKNGTLVNGVRVQRQALRHGDTVTVGDVDLLFRWEPTAGPPSANEPQPRATRALLRSPISRLVRAEDASRSEGRLRTLIEVTKLLPVSADVDALLGGILDLLFQILDIDRAVILLIDPKTGELAPRAERSVSSSSSAGPKYSQNIVQYVLQKSVAALFTDAAFDPRLAAARSVVVQSIRASMCVPLKPKNDVIGVIYVDNQSAAHAFVEDDLELLLAFASQASMAIENASLYARLEAETVARMQLIMDAKLASMGAMVAAIAHELRNPLNLITNFAELSEGLATEIEEGLRAPAERGEFEEAAASLRDNTARIREHGRRADAIIQGMLQHARRRSSERALADVNAIVAESVRIGCEGPMARGLEVRVVAEYDPALGAVEIAASEIGRVFFNVVDNALYSMREKRRQQPGAAPAELQVRTAARGENVEVRVRDNGLGIPKDVEERIFEPFFTTKPAGQGTGLGLSLSREIVVQGHHGTMRAETVAGEWAELVITLPRRHA